MFPCTEPCKKNPRLSAERDLNEMSTSYKSHPSEIPKISLHTGTEPSLRGVQRGAGLRRRREALLLHTKMPQGTPARPARHLQEEMAAGIRKQFFAELTRETSLFLGTTRAEETKTSQGCALTPLPLLCSLSAKTEALFESFFVSVCPLEACDWFLSPSCTT